LGVINIRRRNDIQVLRAVSVLAVVIYHAELGLPAGFIGVDIFFVISGYVVTLSHFGTSSDTDSNSALHFAVRRCRRILPPVFLTVVSILFFSLLIFSPFGEFQEAWSSTIPALFFYANFFYANQDTYESFATDAFRHFWSLAVEEQFYIFYLFVLVVASLLKLKLKFGVDRVVEATFWLFGVASLTSLVMNQILGVSLNPWFGYFSPLSRMWQLSAGVVLACRHRKSGSQFRIPTSLRSLSVSVLVLSFFSRSTPDDWPNLTTLAPVIAVLLLLDAGRKQDLRVNRGILRSLVQLGDRSFGIYLLHWPALVLVQRHYGNSVIAKLVAIGLSTAMAFLMKRFLEDRFISSPTLLKRPRRQVMYSMIAAILTASIAFGFKAVADTGLGLQAGAFYDADDSTWSYFDEDGRSNPNVSTFAKSMSFASTVGCADAIESPVLFCQIESLTDNPVSDEVILVGDSQARALSDGFNLATQGFSRRWISWASGCPFVAEAYPAGREECKLLNDERLRFLEAHRPDVVVISNLASRYLESDLALGYTGVSKMSERELLNTYSGALKEAVMRLSALGVSVVVVLDIPIPPNYGGRPTLLRSNSASPYVLERSLINEHLEILFTKEPLSRSITVLSPSKLLCQNGLCEVINNRSFLYADNDHLSPSGSVLLADSLKEAINRRRND